MGLLDRLKRSSEPPDRPDATAKEIAACVNASSSVSAAEASGRTTVRVTWPDGQVTDLDVADVRDALEGRTGMDRIEVLDPFVKALRPPDPADSDPFPGFEPEPEPAMPAPSSGHEPAAPDHDLAPTPPIADRPEPGPDAGPGPAAASPSSAVDAGPPPEPPPAEPGPAIPPLEAMAPGQPAWIVGGPEEERTAWLREPAAVLDALGRDRVVVFTPTPTDVLVVDPDAVDLVTRVTGDTLSLLEQGHVTLTAVPHLVTASGVVEWEPGANHPCHDLVARIRAAST